MERFPHLWSMSSLGREKTLHRIRGGNATSQSATNFSREVGLKLNLSTWYSGAIKLESGKFLIEINSFPK